MTKRRRGGARLVDCRTLLVLPLVCSHRSCLTPRFSALPFSSLMRRPPFLLLQTVSCVWWWRCVHMTAHDHFMDVCISLFFVGASQPTRRGGSQQVHVSDGWERGREGGRGIDFSCPTLFFSRLPLPFLSTRQLLSNAHSFRHVLHQLFLRSPAFVRSFVSPLVFFPPRCILQCSSSCWCDVEPLTPVFLSLTECACIFPPLKERGEIIFYLKSVGPRWGPP